MTQTLDHEFGNCLHFHCHYCTCWQEKNASTPTPTPLGSRNVKFQVEVMIRNLVAWINLLPSPPLLSGCCILGNDLGFEKNTSPENNLFISLINFNKTWEEPANNKNGQHGELWEDDPAQHWTNLLKTNYTLKLLKTSK